MKQFLLVDVCTRGEEAPELTEHTFDTQLALEQWVKQNIICMEFNVKAGVFKNLKYSKWKTFGNQKVLELEVIETLPSYSKETLISHKYIAQEKSFIY